MRRVFVLAFSLLGICTAAAGQQSSDVQTLQAILTEVRALRQELRVSLARTQNMQILLVRLQMQEGVVAKASEQLADSRSKLSDAQSHLWDINTTLKNLEDSLGHTENLTQQRDLQDRINHLKSDLEIAAQLKQQRQTNEIQAAQQLRTEQDRLGAIESQLDELARRMGNSLGPSPQ